MSDLSFSDSSAAVEVPAAARERGSMGTRIVDTGFAVRGAVAVLAAAPRG